MRESLCCENWAFLQCGSLVCAYQPSVLGRTLHPTKGTNRKVIQNSIVGPSSVTALFHVLGLVEKLGIHILEGSGGVLAQQSRPECIAGCSFQCDNACEVAIRRERDPLVPEWGNWFKAFVILDSLILPLVHKRVGRFIELKDEGDATAVG